MQDLPCNQT